MKFIVPAFLIFFGLKVCYMKQSLLPLAVKEFVRNYFVRNSIKFEVIFIYNKKAFGLLDISVKFITEVEPCRVTQVKSVDVNLYELDHSAILFFNKFENYLRFEDRIFMSNKSGHQDVNLLIVCPNLTTSEVERNLPADKYQIRQYLIEERGEISLKATTLFTSRACHKQQLIEINKFSGTKLQWKKTKFSMSKIDNFHGCRLNILYHSHRFLASNFYWTFDERGNIDAVFSEGFLFVLVTTLQEDFNFIEKRYLHDIFG